MKTSIEKQKEVLKLRDQGLNFTEIGKIMSFDRHTVARIVNKKYKSQTRVKLEVFNNMSNDLYYFIGLLATDGCIYKDRVEISLVEKDIDILEKFKLFLGDNVNILKKQKVINEKTFVSYKIAFRSKEIVELLNSYGLTSRKTFDLKLKIKLNWHILRGIIDGDGSFIVPTKGNPRINIISASEDFLKQISEFLTENNIEHRFNKQRSYYVINISKQHFVLKTIDNLYQETDTFIQRKYFTALQVRNYLVIKLSNSGNQFQESRAKP
jgi:hypothetical protein